MPLVATLVIGLVIFFSLSSQITIIGSIIGLISMAKARGVIRAALRT